MALLPASTPGTAGAAVTYTQVTASDTFANDGRTLLHVKNSDGVNAATVTLTNLVDATADVLGYGSKTFSIPANSDRLLPALDPARYGTTVTVGFTKTGGVTGVTCAVIRAS